MSQYFLTKKRANTEINRPEDQRRWLARNDVTRGPANDVIGSQSAFGVAWASSLLFRPRPPRWRKETTRIFQDYSFVLSLSGEKGAVILLQFCLRGEGLIAWSEDIEEELSTTHWSHTTSSILRHRSRPDWKKKRKEKKNPVRARKTPHESRRKRSKSFLTTRYQLSVKKKQTN